MRQTAAITTATPAVELLLDTANLSQEIAARLTARACLAISEPEHRPALMALMEGLAELLDHTSPDGLI